MKVYIVGRTKMGGSARCIGGILEDGTSVRLMKSNGPWDDSAQLQIGEVWDLDITKAADVIPPHTEDVIVTGGKKIGNQANIDSYLLSRCAPWRGGTDKVFGGKLGFTGNNNGFICQRLGVPKYSTWFWVPDRDLTLRKDGRHYDYFNRSQPRGLVYVGEPRAIPSIAAGTLVRVSLARWWKPSDVEDLEERCYLQLSGWF